MCISTAGQQVCEHCRTVGVLSAARRSTFKCCRAVKSPQTTGLGHYILKVETAYARSFTCHAPKYCKHAHTLALMHMGAFKQAGSVVGVERHCLLFVPLLAFASALFWWMWSECPAQPGCACALQVQICPHAHARTHTWAHKHVSITPRSHLRSSAHATRAHLVRYPTMPISPGIVYSHGHMDCLQEAFMCASGCSRPVCGCVCVCACVHVRACTCAFVHTCLRVRLLSFACRRSTSSCAPSRPIPWGPFPTGFDLSTSGLPLGRPSIRRLALDSGAVCALRRPCPGLLLRNGGSALGPSRLCGCVAARPAACRLASSLRVKLLWTPCCAWLAALSRLT